MRGSESKVLKVNGSSDTGASPYRNVMAYRRC